MTYDAVMGDEEVRARARRVLVTGASGFLGGHVVSDLRAHGFDVFVTGRNLSGLTQVAAQSRIVHASLAELAHTRLDVDAVIHCAALSTPWGRWQDFVAANVEGTKHVVTFARRNGVRRIVHVSSPSVYASASDRLLIREDEVDESNRLNGYIRSKIAAEQLLRAEALTSGAPEIVMLRPRGLIGEGDPSLIPRLIDVHDRIGIPLFRGGSNVIDVTAVENVALAARLALTKGDASAGVYNITNGEPRAFEPMLRSLLIDAGIAPRFRSLPLPIARIAAAVLERVCALLPSRPEPPLTRYTLSTIAYSQTLDISRARSELGYEPEISLNEALRRVAVGLRVKRG